MISPSLRARIRRGHIIERMWRRAGRELQAAVTTLVLGVTTPQPRYASVLTLNADEENATVQALLLGQSGDFKHITLVSPNPDVSKSAVGLAARRLGLSVPSSVRFRKLGFSTLLREYRRSLETYTTHVLLPGRDLSRRRRHVHLTHGSGPKPDTTFRSPANVLASITPHWVDHQLREYHLPPDTEVTEYMPRLEIMRRSSGDSSILVQLGLDPARPLVVWAPTYRMVRRGREVRVSGTPLNSKSGAIPTAVEQAAAEIGGQLVAKIHPHDVDDYSGLAIPVFTNEALRAQGVTPYELFGVARLLVTDYSSIYVERKALNLPYLLVQPDKDEFAKSYRGLR